MELLIFVWKKHFIQIMLATLLFGGLISASIYEPEWHKSVAWMESIAGCGTFFFAIFLWVNNSRQEWESGLPKRLTAYFQYNNQNVMIFRNVLLHNEGDARAWAQQIARQKAGGDIQFEPFFRFKDRGVCSSTNDKSVKLYEITFFLTTLPESLKVKLGYNEAERRFVNKQFVEWIQVDHEDGKITLSENEVGNIVTM